MRRRAEEGHRGAQHRESRHDGGLPPEAVHQVAGAQRERYADSRHGAAENAERRGVGVIGVGRIDEDGAPRNDAAPRGHAEPLCEEQHRDGMDQQRPPGEGLRRGLRAPRPTGMASRRGLPGQQAGEHREEREPALQQECGLETERHRKEAPRDRPGQCADVLDPEQAGDHPAPRAGWVRIGDHREAAERPHLRAPAADEPVREELGERAGTRREQRRHARERRSRDEDPPAPVSVEQIADRDARRESSEHGGDEDEGCLAGPHAERLGELGNDGDRGPHAEADDHGRQVQRERYPAERLPAARDNRAVRLIRRASRGAAHVPRSLRAARARRRRLPLGSTSPARPKDLLERAARRPSPGRPGGAAAGRPERPHHWTNIGMTTWT